MSKLREQGSDCLRFGRCSKEQSWPGAPGGRVVRVSRARKLSGQLALSMLGDMGGPGVRKRLCPCEFGVSGRAMGSAGLPGEARWVLIAVLLVAALARPEGARAPEGLPAGPGPSGHPQSAQPPPPGPRATPGLETELGAQVRWSGALGWGGVGALLVLGRDPVEAGIFLARDSWN